MSKDSLINVGTPVFFKRVSFFKSEVEICYYFELRGLISLGCVNTGEKHPETNETTVGFFNYLETYWDQIRT